MSLPPEVAELVSVRSLAIRDLDPALVIATIDIVEFLAAKRVDLEELVRSGVARHPCERALVLVVRLRRLVLRGETSWGAVLAHLEERLEHEVAN